MSSQLIIWHTWLLALEEFTPLKLRVSKIKRRLLQEDFEFSSVITKQQVHTEQQLQYNIHSSVFVISGNFENLGEKSILLNVFQVVSDGFIQHIPY